MYDEGEEIEEEETEDTWTEKAREAASAVLDSAVVDVHSKTVEISNGHGFVSCKSYDELRDVVYEVAVDAFNEHVPWDAGEAVFEFEGVDELINAILGADLKDIDWVK